MIKTLLSLLILCSPSFSTEALDAPNIKMGPVIAEIQNEKSDDLAPQEIDGLDSQHERTVYILTLNSPHAIVYSPQSNSNGVQKELILILEMLENLSEKPHSSVLCSARQKVGNTKLDSMKPIFSTVE